MKIDKSRLKKVSIEYRALQNIITGDVLQVKILRIMSLWDKILRISLLLVCKKLVKKFKKVLIV